jgi:isochorismate hydrolase
MCDRHTAYDAFVRDLDIVVVEDGVDAFTESDHVSGLDYMTKIYGAKVRKASEIIKEIED